MYLLMHDSLDKVIVNYHIHYLFYLHFSGTGGIRTHNVSYVRHFKCLAFLQFRHNPINCLAWIRTKKRRFKAFHVTITSQDSIFTYVLASLLYASCFLAFFVFQTYDVVSVCSSLYLIIAFLTNMSSTNG